MTEAEMFECYLSQLLCLLFTDLCVLLCLLSLVATVTAALTNIGTLSSLVPLPSIMQKPPVAPAQPNIANLEEVKRKVAKQANSISIKEFTDVSFMFSMYQSVKTTKVSAKDRPSYAKRKLAQAEQAMS